MTVHFHDSLGELAKKTQNQRHWKQQFQTLQETHDRQNKSHIDLKTQHTVLLQQSEIIKTELNELREQNKVLAHDKWILGQEKAQLYDQLKQLESHVC